MEPKIAKVVVGLPVDGPFDYTVSKDIRDRISIGQRVRVSFNRHNRVGFVVGEASRSAFKKLNPILSLLDNGPVLGSQAMQFAKTFSDYYGCSLGEAIETFLPAALRNDRSSSSSPFPSVSAGRDTAANDEAIASADTTPLDAGSLEDCILVHDQTRFKRWPFVLGHIRKVIDDKKRIIVLVPEASFIKETVSLLEKAMACSIAVFGRKLTPKKELEQWEQIRKGEFTIVIGTRSSVFAPVPNLGLIVINEEENSAYKQEQTPHYHVHEVAQMRVDIDQCRIIFTSSVPSAEIWENAKRCRWKKVIFQDEQRKKIQIIDMNNYNPRKTSILSFPLQNAIRETLEAQGKVILFMNRLGFSTQTHCQQCGFILKCRRCNVNLTYLYSKKIMACRHCNFKAKLPKTCPECQGAYLRSTGTGVEKIESEAARLYPNACIHHYDRQSKVFPKGADIIIATQAVFRQHDQWTASLVAILNFDAQMHHVDFRSGQKAFSLLVRLRQLAEDMLLIQTRIMNNYCIKAIRDLNFDKFYREELKQRRELELPPYKHLIALGLRGKNEDLVFEQSIALFNKLEKHKPRGITISDPHPDVSPKLRDQYRFTILLKGKSVKRLLTHIKSELKSFRKRSIIITVNVDP